MLLYFYLSGTLLFSFFRRELFFVPPFNMTLIHIGTTPFLIKRFGH